ncbi:MAG TPA: DUF819 family protein [bacterium]|nr:DUF819 family protein [bacterium]
MNKAVLIEDSVLLFVYFTGVVGFIFWVSSLQSFKGLFRFLPPLVWAYFLPMIGTTFSITPADSTLYGFLRKVLLPFLMVLLLLSTDIKAIWRLGPLAIATMLFGSVGVVVGAVISFSIFKGFLPAESWKGIAALSGSWIGGSANMAAIAESVKASPDLYAPLIVVDTVVGYAWLGILLALVGQQDRIDLKMRAKTAILHSIAQHLAAEDGKMRRPLTVKDFTAIVAVGFVVSTLAMKLGGVLPEVSNVISTFTWGILILTFLGIVLSFTRLRQLEFAGAGSIGYGCLYILLASIGAQADLRAVINTPQYILLGVVWMGIHAVLLFVGAWILRSPMFLVATGSMANIGGTSSGPVVAAAYQPSLAPVGLLLAVLGGVIGTPLGILVAWICSKLA